METAQGTVNNCQHSFQVSGGANRNQQTSTSYITLFRLNGRQVEFRTSSPSAIAEGDQVIAVGPMYRGVLNALACRNITTEVVEDSGIWTYVFAAVLVAGIGTAVSVLPMLPIGIMVRLGVAVVTALSLAYLVHRILLTRRAVAAVRG